MQGETSERVNEAVKSHTERHRVRCFPIEISASVSAISNDTMWQFLRRERFAKFDVQKR